MRNIALTLKYLGTAYHGWQVQKTVSSVCETMEKGLSKVCGGNVKLVGCGRTDAGVHAERYIANFHTESRIPVERLPFAINTHTPEDIVVREALEVVEDFNAILSCQKKEYTYRIYNSRIKNPFYVNRAYFYPKHLDETVMQRAAQQFVGTHDFAAVRSVGTEVKSMRQGRVNLKESFAAVKDGEMIVSGMHISPYEQGNIFNTDPLRPKKLLLHKAEIRRLAGMVQRQGYTLVPLSVYLKDGRMKMELGLCRGKKLHDKRDDMAQRDAKRDIDRALKNNGRGE